MSAERLDADDSADDVAVHVDIAGTHASENLRDGLVDPRVNAVCQPVSGCVDRIDELGELVALPAHHVQDRSERFAFERAESVDTAEIDQRRCEKGARRGLRRKRQLDDMAAREKNWAAFIDDPEWKKLRATAGYTDPEIVSNITSIILRPTPYSQI